MKLTLASRAAFGNEKPRSMTPFTTLNMVVTPPMPRARTMTARAQKAFSLTSTRSPMRRSRRTPSAPMILQDHTQRTGARFQECGTRQGPPWGTKEG